MLIPRTQGSTAPKRTLSAHRIGTRTGGKHFDYDGVVKFDGTVGVDRIEEAMTADIQGSIIEIGGVAARPSLDGETDIDLDVLREALDYLRPALQADGGDVVLTGVDGGTVHLELVGACGGCPISETTVTAGIERILRDRVPGVSDIVATG